MKRPIVWLIAFLVATSGQVMGRETSPKVNGLEVTLLLFSGRPNPVLTLTDPKEIHDILSLAKALPRHPALSTEETVIPARLGYRGIAVRNLSEAMPDIAAILVHRTSVQLKPNAAVAQTPSQSGAGTPAGFRLDAGAVLEARLLALARKHGVVDEQMMQHIVRGR